MNVPAIRFPEFNKSWKSLTIKEVGNIRTGNTPPTKHLEYYGGKIPFYGPGDFSDNTVKLNASSKFLTKQGLNVAREAYVGDTAVVCIGSVGNTALVTKGGAFNQQINVVTPNEKVSSYFMYLVISNCCDEIKSRCSKTTLPMINKTSFSEIPISIPSLPEQQRIAAFLSAVDRKIELLTKKQDAIARYKAGLMQKLFSQEVRFTREDGSTYPDWEERALMDLARITMGQSPASSSYNDQKNGLPLIQGNADTKDGYSFPRRFTSVPTKICSLGDILISVRAPVGDVCISIGEACIGRGIASIRANNENSQDFIHQFLLSMKEEWDKFSQGSTFTAISGTDLRSIKVIKPCYDEQKKIAITLKSFDKKIHSVNQKIETMKAFKKGLLQQMFV